MAQSLLRVSEATALALHATIYLAAQGGRRVPVAEIARAHQASEATLSKVMQRMVHARIVRSVRGPKGGFELADPPEEITLLQVFESTEGPLDEGACLFPRQVCGGSGCILGDLASRVSRQVREYLQNTTVSQVTEVYQQEGSHAKEER
jgi:Rrf2 family protein